MSFKPERCPVCQLADWTPNTDGVYEFKAAGEVHRLDGLHGARCPVCETTGYLPGQLSENHGKIRVYQEQFPDFLPSDLLVRWRETHWLPVDVAAQLCGVTVEAYQRMEAGDAEVPTPVARLVKLLLAQHALTHQLAGLCQIRMPACIA